MIGIVVHRLLISIPVIFVATALSFVLTGLVPGDPAQSILGPLATPEQHAALRAQLGIDRPLHEQYGNWLVAAAHGDLGSSLFTGEPVTTSLRQRLEVTLSLLTVATLVSALVGVSLGVLAASRGGITGRLVDAISMAGLAIPNFWLALLLIAMFAVGLHWLPATGYTSFAESPVLWARSLALPVFALSLGSSTLVAKQTRDSVRSVLEQDFIRVLCANGFRVRSILLRHVLRNAAIPVLTVLGVVFINLIGGSLLVEQIFALPGLGSRAVLATTQHDLPVIQGIVLCFTLLVLAVNLLIDLTYGIVDPRVRVS